MLLRTCAAALLVGSVAIPHHVLAQKFEQCDARQTRYELIMLGNLGAPGGYATDVNELGQVTGASSRSDQVGRAFTWDCLRGMANIGALSEAHFASVGLYISIRGEIVRQSFSEDQAQAFIWDQRQGMRSLGDGYPLSFNNRGDATLN